MQGIRRVGLLMVLLLQGLLVMPARAEQAPVVQGPPPSTESVLKLIRLAGMGDFVTQMTASYEAQAKKAVKGAPKELWDLLHSKLDPKAMSAKLVPIYQKVLSQKDVNAAIAFYQTPEGQHVVKMGPPIVQASAQAVEQLSQAAGIQAAEEFCGAHPADAFCVKTRAAGAAAAGSAPPPTH